MRVSRLIVPSLVILALSGCSEGGAPSRVPDLSDAAPMLADLSLTCADPGGDEDGDGIANGLEACEKGRDTDKDGVPDWRDLDSDGDGMLDRHEDQNGDGMVGCCLSLCGKSGSAWQAANCKFTAGGCGEDQLCKAGACVLAANCFCAGGETSPYKKDTFGWGKLDSEWPCGWTKNGCKKSTWDQPVQERAEPSGDWRLALDPTATYGMVANVKQVGAAAWIDYPKYPAPVAGFTISRPAASGSISREHQAIVVALAAALAGSTGALVTRASGAHGRSHDKYYLVRETTLALHLHAAAAAEAGTIRDAIIAAALGVKPAALGNLSRPRGAKRTTLLIRLSTLLRFKFKQDAAGMLVRDSHGNPVDSGDASARRLLLIGAVAAMDDYANLKQPTRFLVDDLAGGTALATYQDSLAFECDVGTITRLPAADIIWVLDDQVDHWQIKPRLGSTLITNFFARALASGLDFRMGVANMGPPGDASCLGKFCSAPSSDPADKGGKDWFLLPGQQSSFHGCLANPPCLMGKTPHGLTAARAAVKRHLPRASNDPARIRNNALLVIILVSDDAPHELSQVLAAGDVKKCTLDAGTENKVELLLRPELNYYTGVTNPEAAAQVHLLGGLCGGSCGARVGHGYLHLSRRLAGLQFDICQPDLGPSLEILVEEIVGKASPIVLDYVPVASTLRVAMDAVRVFRSRTNGFEYRGGGNSLVFINTKYKKGSEVVTGYKRWRRQEKL